MLSCSNTGPSLLSVRMSGDGTFPPFANAAIANAASLRGCGMLAVALQAKSPERSFKAQLRHEIQTVLLLPAATTTQTRVKCELAALAPMTFFGSHGSARGRVSPPTLLKAIVLSRLRYTNSAQAVAIFGLLEIVKFGDIA